MQKISYISFSVLLLVSFAGLSAHDFIIKENQPHTMSCFQKNTPVRDFIFDCFHGCKGTQDASPDVMDFVINIMKELHIPIDSIRIIRMSKAEIHALGQSYGGFRKLGHFAADSVGILAFPKYIFINEDWFHGLPEGQKRFLVGREIMRITNYHGAKKFIWQWIIALPLFASIGAGAGYILSDGEIPVIGIGAGIGLLFNRFIFPTVLRKHYTYAADKDAARNLQCAQDGAEFCYNVQVAEDDANRELPQWLILRFFRSLGRIPTKFAELTMSGWEPSWRSRAETLQALSYYSHSVSQPRVGSQ